MKLPKINADLLVQDLNDEVLVYDQTTDKSYCLNSTVRTVFNHCDGEQTVADVKLPKDFVYLSLDELKKNNLIQDDYVSPLAGMNRREVVKRVGLASMIALPMISTLVAPQASHAASTSSDCVQPGITCQGAGLVVYCPQLCNETITFAFYPGSVGSTCSTAEVPTVVDCANPANKGIPAPSDFRRF